MTMRRGLKLLVALAAVLPLLWMSSCSRPKETAAAADPLAAGWNDYRMGEFDRGVARFEAALAANPPGSEEQLQALYGLGTIWNLRRPGEDPEKARRYFRQVVDTSPKHDLAAWSLLALARMKHLVPVGSDPDYPEVYKAYQQVVDRYPDHLAGKEAFIYLQAALISTLKDVETRKAVAALEKFVQGSSKEFVGSAWSLLAVSYATLNLPEKRLEAEIKSLETTEVDPTNPFTEFAWAYWNIATIAEFEVGDFDLARTYYKKLIDEYPTDIRVYGAKKALKRMDELEERIRAEATR